MRTPRDWIRKWLGIEHLSNYVGLTRKELGLGEAISTITNITTGQMEPINTPEGKALEAEITKGYVNK